MKLVMNSERILKFKYAQKIPIPPSWSQVPLYGMTYASFAHECSILLGPMSLFPIQDDLVLNTVKQSD